MYVQVEKEEVDLGQVPVILATWEDHYSRPAKEKVHKTPTQQ
jgi:hypothetical protein